MEARRPRRAAASWRASASTRTTAATPSSTTKLTQVAHPPLSPPPPASPSPPPPSPSPPPSPPNPPPNRAAAAPSPPPSPSLLLEDYFRDRQQSAAKWPQIEAGSDRGGPTDYYDVIEGALAFTGDNTYARYTQSAMPPASASSTGMYMVRVTYRTSMSGDDKEVDNDAKVILCPAGKPYNGYIWSATPWSGEADKCVRVETVDDDSGRITAQIDTPDGNYVDSTRCDVNVTSVQYTVHVNSTAVRIENDAGCSAVELGTLIGAAKADLYLATDDDYGSGRSSTASRCRRTPPLAATSRPRPPRDHPPPLVVGGHVARQDRDAARPDARAARQGLRHAPAARPGGRRRRADRVRLLDVGAAAARWGWTDKYSVVLCEAGSLPADTGDKATTGDLVKCASAFDPDAYKVDVDATIISTRATTSRAPTCRSSRACWSASTRRTSTSRASAAPTRSASKFRSPATSVAHSLTPPFVAGIEISIGEYAGDGGFGGNISHVVVAARGGFIWNDSPAQTGGGKRPSGPGGRLVDDPTGPIGGGGGGGGGGGRRGWRCSPF